MWGRLLKTLRFPYKPRLIQQYIHTNLSRFNIIVMHRRGGKTVCCIAEICMKALMCKKRNPHFAYIAPTYSQAHKVAWEYFYDFLKDMPNVKFNKKDYSIQIEREHLKDKITIWLLSARDYDNIRGIYLDGCVFDEYAMCYPDAYTKVIRPALSDRAGWIIFIGTPSGMNHFFDIYKKYSESKAPEYFSCIFPVSQTGLISKGELDLAKEEMSEAEYLQEYECSFEAGVTGAYYMKALSVARLERVTEVPYDPGACVDTFWDLGMNDMTSIWFRQKVAGQWRYIDYLEGSDKGLNEYVKELNVKPYVYGKHVLPHDGALRELGTGKSRAAVLRDLGLRHVQSQKRARVLVEGIEAARRRIQIAWFDKLRCARGLDCLAAYHREWDSKRAVFKGTPAHDWSSHAADAFRTSAVDNVSGDMYLNGIDLANIQTAINDYDVFSGVGTKNVS